MSVLEKFAFTPPGEVGIHHSVFKKEQCRKIAWRAGPVAVLRSTDYRRPVHIWSYNYDGVYDQNKSVHPSYLSTITDQLDINFPEGYDQTSVLRIRLLRRTGDLIGDHVDDSLDYRYLVFVGGSGVLYHRPYLSCPSEAVPTNILSSGDVVVLNNTEKEARVMHHLVPDPTALLVVYGKLPVAA